jgi:flagellar P-ring protein precursor FlgI
MNRCRVIAGIILAVVATTSVAPAATPVRLKDITTVQGERTNVLVGLGLVTGLAGTGGKNPITREFIVNLSQRFGIRAEPDLIARLRTDTTDKSDNTSVVVVMAQLPFNKRKGEKVDVIVSCMDDAKNLAGGVLGPTPLAAVDGEIYALAFGAISTGGFSFSGEAASVQKNHPTSGRIPDGAQVEKETCNQIGRDGKINLVLRQPDYSTVCRAKDAINATIPDVASVLDSGTLCLTIPVERATDIPAFLADIGELRVTPDGIAKVIINERTGTVVVGDNVRLSRVLVTHANLSVMTGEAPEVSQPNPFGQGETTTVPRSQVDVVEEKKALTVVDEQATVADLAHSLNALGVTPRDLSSIFQQLKAAGALHAELELK